VIEIDGVKYMTQKEASYRYGFSQSWFKDKRLKKKPPISFKLRNKGKALYPLIETDKWFKENIISSED
jgi:hypothetical protein